MKDEVVAEKEFPQGTCNIGEYLAIIEALQYRQKEGLDDIPIYSDSLIGIKRVREKRHRCKSDITERPQVAEEIKRQEEWLRDYTGSRNIHFRETKEW
jgi:ribonuclease HI